MSSDNGVGYRVSVVYRERDRTSVAVAVQIYEPISHLMKHGAFGRD